MDKSASASTFTTDSRKQGYLIHNLIWEDAEDYQLTKGPKKPKNLYKKHPKSRPKSLTFVLLNVLGCTIGNIYRFPAMAYLHGGGKFLIAYGISLIFVAKPIFYLEVAMGQFTGQGSGKWWCVCPAFTGIAIGQLIASLEIASYYGLVSSFSLLYTIQSFNLQLPWLTCESQEKLTKCVDSNVTKPFGGANNTVSDLYFRIVFFNETTTDPKISAPNFNMIAYVALVWLFVGILLYNGVKVTGSFAYIAATIPFIILIYMCIKTSELPGAKQGIDYLFAGGMSGINAEIWYMATVQAFFSLNASVGVASYLASQRNFRQRLNRYVFLITIVNFTLPILASIVVFATLGNLAHVLSLDVKSKTVYKGGIELASVIYTDAIPKVAKKPEGLAVGLLSILAIAGIGSTAVVMHSAMSTVWDVVPHISAKIMAPVFAVLGLGLSVLYLSPTGLSNLQLADHYIAGGIMIHTAIFEVAVIAYIYGLEKYCKDITFMTRKKIHIYWRVCLALVTPGLLLKILIDYIMDTTTHIQYKGTEYSKNVQDIVFKLQFIGEVMIGFWLFIVIISFLIGRKKHQEKFILGPKPSYGPEDSYRAEDWKRFIEGLKRCSWKDLKYIPDKVLYPFKVLVGTLNDDVLN